MKKIKYFIALFGIVSIFLVGCSNAIENEEQYIKVQNRIGDENNYEDFKEITDTEQVEKVKDIIEDINWEIAEVEMVRPADYRFIFQLKNPKIETKAVSYELWISPNKDKVELVIDAESKYIQLDTDTSAELFKILVGEELSDSNGFSDVNITKVSISKSSGFGKVNSNFFTVYEAKETLDIFKNVISNAVKQDGIVDIAEPEFDVEVIYTDGNKQGYHLWVGEKGQKSTLMDVNDTHTIYLISEDLTNKLIDLIK